MLKFLKQSKKYLKSADTVCIVIGNESCDLDSAVSAVSLAYIYQKKEGSAATKNIKNFLPVLNIPLRDYALKTEVKFFFNKYAITEEVLTFRDELSDEFIGRNNCILVDHHASPLSARCLEIYDHRPLDPSANLPSNCQLHCELVGSCATLIAEQMLKNVSQVETFTEYIQTGELLRGAIILDTVNFSEEAGRSTLKDREICEALEERLGAVLGSEMGSRDEVFRTLVEARSDISSLTAAQLLRKDLKIIGNPSNATKIALPGFPMLVKDFVALLNAEEAVREFAEENNCSVIFLLGMHVEQSSGLVSRDIGIIDIRDNNLFKEVMQRLSTSSDPNLCLELYDKCNFMNGCFYRQNNIKATRKHILPLVRGVLEQHV